ncbi:MAG: hypothetical protein EP329_17710 [Deltaproteobacteria bacterium]|nr:MAG: hypothetical protein EP329_17710 [Deltaproteobacteria bacterium]
MAATRLKVLVAAAFALGALTACEPGPTEVYYSMSTAAEMGDLDGFLDGFTKESRPLIQAQLSLSEAYGQKNDNPVRQLVFDAVDSEKTEGDTAILEVSSGGRKQTIKMVKTDDGWKIDTKDLAEFWDDLKKNKR